MLVVYSGNFKNMPFLVSLAELNIYSNTTLTTTYCINADETSTGCGKILKIITLDESVKSFYAKNRQILLYEQAVILPQPAAL
ncbi:MAG: hypothetical protein CMN56_07825 [Sneathiella sp.]|nr:hypothetical protein [Sneathiella sp.]